MNRMTDGEVMMSIQSWRVLISKKQEQERRIRELESSAAKKDNAIIEQQKRISELEAKLDRVQCAANELAGALADD